MYVYIYIYIDIVHVHMAHLSRVSSSISPKPRVSEESRGNETRLQEELAAWSPGENW